MLRSIEPFRTTTLLTFVIGLAEIIWLYAMVAHRTETRDRIPGLLESMAIHALGLFVLSGLVGLALIWRLTASAIPGVIAGAFASVAILDTGFLARAVPVTYDSGPQYVQAVISLGVVAVALGISRRRLANGGRGPQTADSTP